MNYNLFRYHGVDERISIQNCENLIDFYQLLLENTDKIHLEKSKSINIEL